MKKFILILVLVAIGSISLQAQLLKKIKDKAAKAIDPKKTDADKGNDENNSTTATSSTQNTDNAKISATPPSNGSIVFSLADDESLLYDESKILSKNNKVSYSFVVQNKKYQYFLIEDGNRTGPFKESPIKSLKPSENNESLSSTKSDEISIGEDRDPVAIQYSKTINGKLFIVFNGKNYGPYDFVPKMIVSPNKKQFFAIVTIGSQSPMMAQMGMGNAYMVDEGNLKQKVGVGNMVVPTKFLVSESFKQCMATVLDQTNQQVISVTSTGKQDIGTMADMYSGNSNNTFVSDMGDIISIPSQSPTQVLVNGKEAASFKVPIKSMDRLFLTPDISKSVYYEKGKIYRANGTEENLSGVIFPKVVTVDNETAVYYFKMYKNENGSKDVYLCKKNI